LSFERAKKAIENVHMPYKIMIGGRPELTIGGMPLIRIGVYVDLFDSLKRRVKKV
jgi:hypothetical protein